MIFIKPCANEESQLIACKSFHCWKPHFLSLTMSHVTYVAFSNMKYFCKKRSRCQISKVHKPRMRVLAKSGQKMVWSFNFGREGSYPHVNSMWFCSCNVVPPLIIFPRARMNDSLKVGAPTGTHFKVSSKGWINHEIFLHWLYYVHPKCQAYTPLV